MALIHSTVLLFREFFSFKSAVGISASLLFSFSTTPKTPNTPNTPKHAKTAVFCLLLSLCILSIQIQAVCLSLLQPLLNTPLCGRQIYPLPCMFATLESAVSLTTISFPSDSQKERLKYSSGEVFKLLIYRNSACMKYDCRGSKQPCSRRYSQLVILGESLNVACKRRSPRPRARPGPMPGPRGGGGG